MTLGSPSGPYRGQVIAFGTRHGKHHQVRDTFAQVLGAKVVAPADIDTDQFGTFTGDTARTLDPIAAARAKAHLGMAAAATRYGLASEASYGPLPGVGVPGHEEILLFLDPGRGLEIVEGERCLIELPAPLPVTADQDLDHYLHQAGFPDQALVVRPHRSGTTGSMVKGVTNRAALTAAIATAAAGSDDGQAFLEADLRAHHNPTRRVVLTRLGRRMAQRLATLCPACRYPGYGRTDTERGLPCAACATPTDLITADLHTCGHCLHHHRVFRPATTADPRWCPRCNP